MKPFRAALKYFGIGLILLMLNASVASALTPAEESSILRNLAEMKKDLQGLRETLLGMQETLAQMGQEQKTLREQITQEHQQLRYWIHRG